MTFAEHLEAATELVKLWPEWKKQALREALSARKQPQKEGKNTETTDK